MIPNWRFGKARYLEIPADPSQGAVRLDVTVYDSFRLEPISSDNGQTILPIAQMEIID